MIKKVLNKYHGLSAPVKASFWFLICGFVQKGMSMLTTPVFTRIMTESEYGRNSVYTSWYDILFIIATFELAAGVYTRGLIKYEEDAERFSSALLSLSTVLILTFSSVYFIFNEQINNLIGTSTYLMVMMIIEMWAVVSYQFWSNRERVAYRYKKLVALMLAFTVLRPLVSIVFVLCADETHQVEARVTGMVLVNVVLFAGLYISMVKRGKCFFDKSYWKYALLFNLPLIPHYLSKIVLGQADRIMIDKFCGSAEAGYYSVAYSIAMVMQMFSTAVSSTMNPWIYRSIKEQKYKNIGKVSYSILIAIAGMNFAIVAFAPELLKILAPSNYYVAVWVVPPVTASVYFTFLYNLFATFEYYYHKTQWVMYASLVGAVANIVLNAIFIPKFGFIAAGYTTLACYIMFSIAHYIFMSMVCKECIDGQKVYDIRIIMLIGLLLIGASALMIVLYNYIILRYSALIIMMIIAFINRKKLISTFKELKKN